MTTCASLHKSASSLVHLLNSFVSESLFPAGPLQTLSALLPHPPLSPSLTTTPKINLNHKENTHSPQLFNPLWQGRRGRGAQGSSGELEKNQKTPLSSFFFCLEKAARLLHHGSTALNQRKTAVILKMPSMLQLKIQRFVSDLLFDATLIRV